LRAGSSCTSCRIRRSRPRIGAPGRAPDWNAVPRDEAQHLDPQVIEAEWFAFGGHIYQREISSSGDWWLAIAETSAAPAIRTGALLGSEAIDAATRQLAPGCGPAISLGGYDIYATAPNRSEARVFRVICGDVRFDIDAANGAIRDRLDRSQRAYRSLFSALHRLDFPVLAGHPALRTFLVVVLCACGFIFSLSGVRDRVAKNPPVAKSSRSIAECSWLMKEHLLCRKRRQYVSFSRGLHGRLHMRGGSNMRIDI
jgi:hypothetical protein